MTGRAFPNRILLRGAFAMLKLYTKARTLWLTRDQGATAVEYGLIVALIAVFIITGLVAAGTKLEALFQTIAGKL
jgi:pilus assembly protein Flp/PilA